MKLTSDVCVCVDLTVTDHGAQRGLSPVLLCSLCPRTLQDEIAKNWLQAFDQVRCGAVMSSGVRCGAVMPSEVIV